MEIGYNTVKKMRIKNHLFIGFMSVLVHIATAQSIQRQVISSSGNTVNEGKQIVRQTIGQPYQTLSTYNNEVLYRPGFQQPIFRMEAIQSSFSINVFPNPASFFLNLSSDKLLDNVKITIHDELGRLIYETELSDFTKYQVACNAWANGAYFLNVTNNDKFYTSKIILQR